MGCQQLKQSHWCHQTSIEPPEPLSFPGSMTEELGRLSGQKPLILKLEEQIAQADPVDCQALSEDKSALLWQRKIILGNQSPWLLGYTLASPSDKSPQLKALQNMGDSPLGNKLFASDDVWRQTYEIGLVGSEDNLWKRVKHWLPELNYPLWGRRSIFSFHGKPVLIYEIFLPTCPGINYPA